MGVERGTGGLQADLLLGSAQKNSTSTRCLLLYKTSESLEPRSRTQSTQIAHWCAMAKKSKETEPQEDQDTK